MPRNWESQEISIRSYFGLKPSRKNKIMNKNNNTPSPEGISPKTPESGAINKQPTTNGQLATPPSEGWAIKLVDFISQEITHAVAREREEIFNKIYCLKISGGSPKTILERVRAQSPYTVLSNEEIAYNEGVLDALDIIKSKGNPAQD